MKENQAITTLTQLLNTGKTRGYIGEAISQLEHALQAAHFAKVGHCDAHTVVASLLHDVGHLLPDEEIGMDGYGVVNHEEKGAEFLKGLGFSKKVCQLVANHVNGKRYLTFKNPNYFSKLSPASLETLKHQGGPMTEQEATDFESDPYFKDHLRVRSYDEQAKIVDLVVSPLEEYFPLMNECLTNTTTRQSE